MSNPLQKYFRQPAIYIKLPSNGHFWPPGSLELGANGELAVYPMTARDELLYKTPDALMNGQSTVDVIQSCVPQIKDAWQCPTIDIDSILVAIKIASYGDELEVETSCPKCQEQNEYVVSLSSVLTTIVAPNFADPVRVDGLEIYLRPQNYNEVTQASLRAYQEQRMLLTVNDSTLSDEEKVRKFTEMFRELTDLTVAGMSRNIRAIKTDQDLVTDGEYIYEFLSNCSKSTWAAIEAKLATLVQTMAKPTNHIQCTNCQHEFDAPLTFDPSNFFG